jgi:hypothetical protein
MDGGVGQRRKGKKRKRKKVRDMQTKGREREG